MSVTVSVVIPNHNYEKTLALCIRSVLEQTRRPDEVIVVDDGSTDSSRDIARRLPCTLIELPGNRGVSAARNAGIAASSGDIVFFLDSDEALAPDAIANALELLAADRPDADVPLGCVHGIIAPEPLIDDGPVEWYRVLHAYWWRRRAVGEVRTAFFAQAAVPRTVLDDVGPFDERLRDSEDLEYSDRLAPRFRILLTDRVVARHDEVDRLGPLLAEQFRRSQLLVPTVLAARRPGSASLTANRPLGVAAVAAAVATLPLVTVAPVAALLPVALLAVFAAADPGLCRFVARHRGVRFLGYFLAVHLLVHLVLLAGAAVGGARWLTRRHRPAVRPRSRLVPSTPSGDGP
ncbi:sugar transferase [Micromonospora craterilacus]|uniref:Sugar transferase n=1 Tax=Micromonospora craterilacus TaxID=1655439 RepID=A0A2W2F4N6_9ACTN|nr:glycosyltransferase family 2 protein [Micromonospora craterilacus]PZG24419.1 sugar transferase [Micromonospora craterilacus]